MAGSIYTTGGTVQAGGGIYLSRKADDELLQLCREGQFAYVLTSRQMGKSSLMVQTAARLEDEDITSVIIDLTKIGTNVTPEQWYLGLLTEIDESLMLDTDIFDWWEENSHLGVTQRLTRFFEEILLGEVDGRIVLFVDEIDTTLGLGFTDDFFIAIRYFYTARAQNSELGRLSVVLIGVASPGDLISDPQRTPFNVGRRVNLTDFSWDEAQGFAAGLSESPDKAQEILRWVMQWTGGHPYLTQRLCQGVVESERTEWSAAAVERLVEQLFLTAGVRNDNNLLFVRDMLVRRTPNENGSVYEVLTTYQEIWRERELVLDEEQSLIKSHLKLAGVVRRDETKGSLYVSNAIYRGVFDEGWVREHLPVNWVKRLQRARAAIGALAAITIVALTFGTWAVSAQRKTDRALDREKTALTNAEAEKERADKERQRAESNAKDARDQEELAIEKAKEADQQAQEAEKQAKRAREQTVIAEQRRTEAQEATQRAETARVAEAEQRKAAEAARLAEAEAAQFAMAREAEANKQTEIATVQALWAQSKALLLAEKPIESMIIALKASQSVEFSQNPEAKPPALAALQQVTYPDKDFILQLSPTFRERNRLERHQGSVRSVAFSTDGNTLASASSDGTVKLWDRNSGTELASLQGHQGSVLSVAFSTDGNTLASASDDGTVKLWDRNSGTELASLQGHQGWVWSVAFSTDGNTLASASSDGTVKLWDRNLDSLIARSCDWLGGYLSHNPDGQRIVKKDGICHDYLLRSVSPQETLFGKFLNWLNG
ncbi:MAG: AAA-like domain-containing protein [Cyanobacteria bacterium P01_A01_bin.15]